MVVPPAEPLYRHDVTDVMTGFLKHVALAGGALAAAVYATTDWTYSVGVDRF